jgi:tetratricopeptide (TPR) repeat protein
VIGAQLAMQPAARWPRGRWPVVALMLLLVSLGSAVVQAHGDLQGQIDSVSARIKSDPGNAELYFRRAELYREHEEWSAAIADYDRVEKLAPGNDAVHLGRAKLLLASGRYEAAQGELNRFLAARPDHVDALVTRARVGEKLGQHALAAEDFARAIQLANPPEPEFYLERAQALASASPGHPEAALACLDEGSARLGPLPTLGLAEIDLEVGQRNFEAALARLDQLSAGQKRQEMWLERRGDILVKADRSVSAVLAYRDAQKAIARLPARQQGTQSMQDMQARLKQKIASAAR